MPTDIALHPMGNHYHGQQRPILHLPVLFNQTGLAEGADSNDIVVPNTGGVLVMQATVKVRFDILKSNEDGTSFTGSPNPAASGVVLQPDIPRSFSLPRGRYRVRSIAYV